MKRLNWQLSGAFLIWSVVPAFAQETAAPEIPPPPATTAPPPQTDRPTDRAAARTFADEAAPEAIGAAVISGPDGRLVVSDLVAASAAANAGLLQGDVVVSVDGHLLTEVDGFHQHLAAHRTEPVQLVVMRDGAQRTIVLNEPAPGSGAVEIRPAVGLRFIQGPQVIVAEVVVGSPADRVGLQPGDHLVAVNGDVISSTDHFITLVAAAPHDATLELTYVRNQERRWAAVEPAAWDVVFGATTARTAYKPSVTDSAVVAAPSITYYTAPYISTNVSPVVVPAAWYYPYYPSYAWYYHYWGIPYYAYHPAYYSPYSYHAPHWPYAWPCGGHPHPHTHPAPSTGIDSARTVPHADSGRMTTGMQAAEELRIVERE